MSRARPNFDRLASCYRAWEWLAFGNALERARFDFLPRLAACRRILALGEGDGRCLARLLRIAPNARIDCLDLSAAMLARAAARLAPADRARVRFRQADLLTAAPPDGGYDAIVTLFFLDCFTAEQLSPLITRLTAHLAPGAYWLWADFAVPPRGFARWRAHVWVAVLYAFFRWQTGLTVRELPPSEAILHAAGCVHADSRDYQSGLVRSVLLRYRPNLPSTEQRFRASRG